MTSIIITAIICGTITLLFSINAIYEYKKEMNIHKDVNIDLKLRDINIKLNTIESKIENINKHIENKNNE